MNKGKLKGVSASVADMRGLTLGTVEPSQVQGETKLPQQVVAAGGMSSLGAIIGFAEDLVRHGLAATRAESAAFATTDCKTLFYRPVGSAVLGGQAALLHEAGDELVWQVTVYAASEKPVAAIILTVRNNGITKSTAANAAPVHLPDLAVAEPEGDDPGQRKREQIASAACEVISRKGFANSTIREIAAAAGMHVPTLYQYVESKEDILVLVYHWVLERLRTDVDAAAARQTSARGKLIAVLNAMLDSGHRYRRQVGVLNRELRSLPQKHRVRVLEEYQAFLNKIAAIISEGVRRGEFRAVEPVIAANLIEAMSDVWPLRQFAVGKSGLEAFRSELTAFVERALSR